MYESVNQEEESLGCTESSPATQVLVPRNSYNAAFAPNAKLVFRVARVRPLDHVYLLA